MISRLFSFDNSTTWPLFRDKRRKSTADIPLSSGASRSLRIFSGLYLFTTARITFTCTLFFIALLLWFTVQTATSSFITENTTIHFLTLGRVPLSLPSPMQLIPFKKRQTCDVNQWFWPCCKWVCSSVSWEHRPCDKSTWDKQTNKQTRKLWTKD